MIRLYQGAGTGVLALFIAVLMPSCGTGDRCTEIRERLDREFAAADDTCTRDAECACYGGGMTTRTGCGGVTGRTSAGRIGRIAAEFHAAGCDYVIRCAPWACIPRCVTGQCVRGR